MPETHSEPLPRAKKTIDRLRTVVASYVPAGSLTLIASGLSSRQSSLWLMVSLMIGISVGMFIYTRSNRIQQSNGDQRLGIVISLLIFPIATLWIQPAITMLLEDSWQWIVFLLSSAASLSAGILIGLFAQIAFQKQQVSRMGFLAWSGLGICLGFLVAIGPVIVQEILQGSFLLTLFGAPLIWAAHPRTAPRSLTVRMLLTLAVTLAAMFLILL